MTPPSELKKQNREKLAKLNIDANLTDLFINNPHFSPRQQTYIVTSLERMSEADNRDVALMVALQVKDTDSAMAITTLTIMYAGYDNRVAKIKQLFPVERIMGARDVHENRLLLIPVDYLTWNERLANTLETMSARDSKEGSSENQIWILGSASDLAQKKCNEKGWLVQIKVSGKIGVNEQGLLR